MDNKSVCWIQRVKISENSSINFLLDMNLIFNRSNLKFVIRNEFLENIPVDSSSLLCLIWILFCTIRYVQPEFKLWDVGWRIQFWHSNLEFYTYCLNCGQNNHQNRFSYTFLLRSYQNIRVPKNMKFLNVK